MTKLTKNQLRERKIYNPYNFAALQDKPKVYLEYLSATNGSVAQYAQWSLRQCGQGGEITRKSIPRPSEQKESYRMALLAWATEQYGIQEWERSPFGSYHPLGTMDRAAALVETK